jgi:hypothetical protein
MQKRSSLFVHWTFQATQQQYLNIEGLDSSDARAIMMKLLTATITVVHVVRNPEKLGRFVALKLFPFRL